MSPRPPSLDSTGVPIIGSDLGRETVCANSDTQDLYQVLQANPPRQPSTIIRRP